MIRNSWPRVLLLLAVAAPGLGQSEDQAYFSLLTSRSFGSNGAPNVTLASSNVDSLDFRVYRINDPVQFFQQLEDSHEFGGRVPRPPHEVTFLELIHDWKARLRSGIRHSVRAQFSESPTAHFQSMLQGKNTAASQAHYPESPVLNPQELVLSFTHPVASHARWGNETSISISSSAASIWSRPSTRNCAPTPSSWSPTSSSPPRMGTATSWLWWPTATPERRYAVRRSSP